MRVGIAMGLALVMLVPGVVLAQQTSGVIAGAVRDATGGVLPGVTVEVASPALIEQVRSAVTGGDGQYRIIDLRPGVYSVTFTLAGFAGILRENVQLTSGFTAPVNAVLEISELQETITVTGASPVVDVQNVTQQQVLIRETLDAIPTGRSYTAIGKLVPGIDASGNAGGHDVAGSAGRDATKLISHGSATNAFKLQIDGMPQMTWIADGSVGVPPSDEIAEEIVLVNSALAAEHESGGVQFNMISRSGSNAFSASMFGNVATEALQSSNLTPELVEAGLGPATIDYLTDFRVSVGGPIVRDRLWNFFTYRDFRPFVLAPVFFDSDPTDFVYTPDTSLGQPHDAKPQWSFNNQMTFQATPRNRIGFGFETSGLTYQDGWGINRGSFAPEAVGILKIRKRPIVRASLTTALSSRVLIDIGTQLYRGRWWAGPHENATGPGVYEIGLGVSHRAALSNNVIGYNDTPYFHDFLRGSVTYTTGSHNIKVGGSLWHGGITYIGDMSIPGFAGSGTFPSYSLRLLNGVPNSVQYLVDPNSAESRFLKGSIYAQDQWTVDRLTLNIGARIDTQNSGYPEQNLPATTFIAARNFPAATVISWRDVSPRVGLVYDVSGDGTTAIKASFSRYVDWDATGLAHSANPAKLSGGTLRRSWTDTNGDFIPQGDPANPLPNGEIGPSPDQTWGTPRVSTRFDPAWALGGWGVRGNNWEYSTSVQQELRSNVSLLVGYFYRKFGNFSVTDNLAVGPGDFDSFCITGPSDARLPDGGGSRLCGLLDLKPALVGQVDNLRTSATNYGDITQNFRGLDVTLNARLPGALLQGGLTTGNENYNFCGVIDKLPEMLISGNRKTPGDSPGYCDPQQSWLTQIKFIGSFDLPWSLNVAATYQNSYNTTSVSPNLNPGNPRLGVQGNWTATNAVVAPELGRNLTGRSSMRVNVVRPGTLWGDRLQQLDIRFARTFSAGGASIKAMVDLYNALNINTTIILNNTYGSTGAGWLNPRGVLPPRVVKFGVQINY